MRDTVTLHAAGNITGMTPEQLEEMHADFAQYDVVRRVERWSIREFMRASSACLTGRVLDYGCGDEPYRGLVRGEYVPYSPGRHSLQSIAALNGRVDAIMCNQVAQYVPNVPGMLARFRVLLRPGGRLVMTFATNWDEVEASDIHRHTEEGMKLMLAEAGFNLTLSARRAEVAIGGFKFPLGYGVLAVRSSEWR